jgi:hypothetical protein
MKNKEILKNKFCVLLTASVDPNGCNFLKIMDPKIREQNYLDSLKLWLSKTNLPLVFCENSGYSLTNIRKLCDRYPGRVEIIQFEGNNYPRHLGKGYGEFLIIKKALEESEFIKNSENIIKVTGRIFISNIGKIIDKFEDNLFVQHTIFHGAFKTVIFIFKHDFFNFLRKFSSEMDDSSKIYFEVVFKKAVEEAKMKGYKCGLFIKPKYWGICATDNIEYKKLFKFSYIYWLDYFIGKIGIKIKYKFPKIYKILKPYFPDKYKN